MNTLLQTDDAQVEIKATADVIKPIFGYARKHVKEAKVHFDSDGIHYEVVDPANVAMAQLHAPAGVFESYEADGAVVGLNLKQTMKALRAGRKRQSDTITLEYEDMQLTTTVNRNYDGTEMDLQNNYATIDPDVLRQEPDLPDLELPVSVTLDRQLFEDVVSVVDEVSEHIRFEDNGSDLLITGKDDESDARAAIRDVVRGEGADSIFSLDYITNDLIKSLKTVDVDEITIELGDQYPMRVLWEKEVNDETIEGTYFMAPRIQS
jgi:proliferating cell nuclear antigen